MPRFRNDSGSVLALGDLGRTVGPFEEFDFPGYDPDVHGPVAGCTRLGPPPDPPDAKPAGKRTAPGNDKEAAE